MRTAEDRQSAPHRHVGLLTFVPDPDWDRPTPSSDEPWEVTCDAYGDTSYGDTFDATF
jgi:hypothetical protein